MYCITVTLCFLQSFQNWEAENFFLSKTVMPEHVNKPRSFLFFSAFQSGAAGWSPLSMAPAIPMRKPAL